MHPKTIDRLANIYITKLLSKGNEDAKAWANRLLSRENVLIVAKAVKEKLAKRGFKVDNETNK